MLLRDAFTVRDLEQLIGQKEAPLVSVIMPTHRAGPEIRQDPIRFRNMLERVELELAHHPRLQEQVEDVRSLLHDQEFWRHQSDALLTYLGGDEALCYQLPVPADELVHVGPRFQLMPLLPLLGVDGVYYVLAVSQGEVRALQCSRQRHAPARVALPDGRKVIQQFVDGEKDLQYHVAGAAGAAGSRQIAFHGHSGYKEQDKVRIFEYFRSIDQALSRHLRGVQTPVVFAGVDYLFPIFREAARSINLFPQHVPGNWDESRASDDELHERSLEVIAPRLEQQHRETVALLREAGGTTRVLGSLEATLRAAVEGRVSRLYVDGTQSVWGRFENGCVDIGAALRPGDEDLLNLAAILTIRQGGRVHVVNADELPGAGPLAALLRY